VRDIAVGFVAGMVTTSLLSMLIVLNELRRSPMRSNYIVSVECESPEAAARAVAALTSTTSKLVTVQRPKHPPVEWSCPDYLEEWN